MSIRPRTRERWDSTSDETKTNGRSRDEPKVQRGRRGACACVHGDVVAQARRARLRRTTAKGGNGASTDDGHGGRTLHLAPLVLPSTAAGVDRIIHSHAGSFLRSFHRSHVRWSLFLHHARCLFAFHLRSPPLPPSASVRHRVLGTWFASNELVWFTPRSPSPSSHVPRVNLEFTRRGGDPRTGGRGRERCSLAPAWTHELAPTDARRRSMAGPWTRSRSAKRRAEEQETPRGSKGMPGRLETWPSEPRSTPDVITVYHRKAKRRNRPLVTEKNKHTCKCNRVLDFGESPNKNSQSSPSRSSQSASMSFDAKGPSGAKVDSNLAQFWKNIDAETLEVESE